MDLKGKKDTLQRWEGGAGVYWKAKLDGTFPLRERVQSVPEGLGILKYIRTLGMREGVVGIRSERRRLDHGTDESRVKVKRLFCRR